MHKGAQWVDSKIVLNWLLASSTATAPTTSVQIGVNFKQTEVGEQNKGWPHAVFLKFVQSVFFATWLQYFCFVYGIFSSSPIGVNLEQTEHEGQNMAMPSGGGGSQDSG